MSVETDTDEMLTSAHRGHEEDLTKPTNKNTTVFPNKNTLVFPNKNTIVFPNKNTIVFPNKNTIVFPNKNTIVFPNKKGISRNVSSRGFDQPMRIFLNKCIKQNVVTQFVRELYSKFETRMSRDVRFIK